MRSAGIGSIVVLLACSSGQHGPAPAGADVVPSTTPATAPDPVGPTPTGVENGLAGTPNWNLRLRATQHQIEGYALTQSASPGDPIPIAVSVTPGPSQFSWIVYRIGYYGGIGAREVLRGGPAPVSSQPACPADASTGLVACGWAPAFTLQTGSDWLTGIYFIRLVRSDGWEEWVPIVLHYRGPAPQVVMIVPTSTSQAYNAFQGESLYVDQNNFTKSGRAYKVSYDRPYAMGFGAGNMLRWDQDVARWLERTGYDVGYLTNEDADRDPTLLSGAKAIVLSGHDEYWSGSVRSAVDSAVASGTSLLLFGANAGYWQIRYEPSADGRDRRIITCYKDDAPRLDPVGASSPNLTVMFRSAPVSRPENALFGVMYRDWNTFGFPFVVRNPDHWALAGTGLGLGDVLPLVGGYEIDATADNGATPAGVEILAEAPFLGLYGGMATAQMVVRQEGAALVFAAGGIDFAAALDGDRSDPRVQRIAANVLARALGEAPPSDIVTCAAVASQGPFASAVTTIAGAAFEPGSDNGPSGSGRLRQPIGVALLPGGSLAVLDRGDRIIRRLDASGALSTLCTPNPPISAKSAGLASDAAGNLYVSDAGSGIIGKFDTAGRYTVLAGAAGVYAAVDGPVGTARFQSPAGLAIQGMTLYVADTGANAIRKIDLASNTVSTISPSVLQPTGVAVAPDGTIYAIENGYQRVVAISGGQLSKVAGDVAGFADGASAQAQLLPHLGLAVLPDGAIAISDPGNYRVRLYRAGQVSTLAGSGRYGGRDGPGDVAELVLPTGLAVDGSGRIYVADAAASTIRLITR